ncbi:glycosyltransferase family 4 protein [Paenibacillus rhizophilus]|uniref:Glycosyltransferase family 1 protein n=1 Tax=Paenibacillus rhizophilus TaxID=1850366 RepID=A0A3N9Q4S0_9BACL|nr:glycosyltransferase family 1 protein [Paenibacillus rhizophilus]RQW12516.1 glycosyltransferase family 1 protein [Paenibacillus rhizophilus]
MRIAFFTDSFYPQINGVSNTLMYLSQYLTRSGIEHMFFAPDYETDEPEASGIPVVRFKGFTPHIYPDCRLSFPPYPKVIEQLSHFKPDVVHIVTELGIGWSGLRAARALNIPIVMSYHTSFDKYLQFYHMPYLSKALWAYMRWFHSFALVNLAPSRSTMQELTRRGIQNLDLWPRGIDLERFHPGHYSPKLRQEMGVSEEIVFLYVGRIAVEKGLRTLADSIAVVNQRYGQQVKWVFTGEGPYLPELIAKKIPNAIFTGSRRGDELAAIYASADVFIFPSGTETFGNVLLEAMASGLPVICTDSGGVTDFTENHQNALVCKYGSVPELTRAIVKMLNPHNRTILGARALETAKSRGWDAVFDRLMLQYIYAANPEIYSGRQVIG